MVSYKTGILCMKPRKDGLFQICGHRASSYQDVEPSAVGLVRYKLLSKVHDIAGNLRDCSKQILNLSIQCKSTNVPWLWSELSDEMREIVYDVSNLANRCASLVSDATSIIRASMGMSDELEVLTELKEESYRKLLHRSCKDAEFLQMRLKNIHVAIKSARERCRSGKVDYNADFRSVTELELKIGFFLEQSRKFDEQMLALLDNSSAPGLMELLVTLLPEDFDLVAQLSQLIDPRGTIVTLDTGKGNRLNSPNNSGVLKCLLSVGYNLGKDIARASTSMKPKSRRGRTRVQEQMVLTLYSVMESALSELSISLDLGQQDMEKLQRRSQWGQLHGGGKRVVAHSLTRAHSASETMRRKTPTDGHGRSRHNSAHSFSGLFTKLFHLKH